MQKALGISAGDIPKLSLPESTKAAPSSTAKRKPADGDSDVQMGDEAIDNSSESSRLAQAKLHAEAAASYIPFLTAEELLPPKLPAREEIESVLLELRKKALVEEYFGDGGS